ncbi:hypothetical protein C3B59_00810 [Cryobacterium zongtaii]|uniref:DUF4190 domain-containing protein n=1 Tax=Cryobacterium zongtaii TaxID=1259217 RepID=A0A2S3ZQN5_9MICO|nr:hypothetical protein [Cryobacterium zongtaii]POH71409.1 hypothetical protein C3B59_00810 [Cryobacterium zongtaii]
MTKPKKNALLALTLVVVGLAISVPVGAALFAAGVQADESHAVGQLNIGMAILGLFGLILVVVGIVVVLVAGARAGRERRGIA